MVILSGVLLVIATVFMVSSSIRLTVVAKEAELEVLRLVGANNKFIRTPLMIEGILQGLLGSSLGMLFLYLIFMWTQVHLTGPGFLNIFEFAFFKHETTASIIVIATLLCSCGSLFSIRKYMRI